MTILLKREALIVYWNTRTVVASQFDAYILYMEIKPNADVARMTWTKTIDSALYICYSLHSSYTKSKPKIVRFFDSTRKLADVWIAIDINYS